MNVYDSARMADVLAPLGYALVDAPDDADMVVLNTCHIREKAAEKVYSELGRLRRIKMGRANSGQATLLAVAGCVAQAEGEEILNRAPYVDMVVGPQAYHRLPELIARVSRADHGGGPGAIDLDFPAEPKFDHLPPARPSGYSAFLTIQEGCNKFCTFCVVPYTRGAEYSRPAVAILDEARVLADGGVREITLLGQNVNAYRSPAAKGNAGLADLIRHLAEIKGLTRIRYTTSHPVDMDDDLIAAHGDVEALAPFVHLPVQSGSDAVLQRMNRRHRVDDYRRVVERLWAVRPDLKLSTDFIVGFPGESEAEFEASLDLAAEIGFVQAFSFKFSERPGTPGALLPDQVPDVVKRERLTRLQQRLSDQQIAFNRECIGQTLPVLFDRPGRKVGQLAGRSPYMQAVHAVVPSSLLGETIGVGIFDASANSLTGALPKDAVDQASVGAAQGVRA